MQFKKTGKLSPYYVGPFEIMERVGPVVYYLALTSKYAALRDIFHVSMLKKYHHDPSHIILFSKSPICTDMAYVKYPIEIIHQTKKVLYNTRIPMVKVLW